MSGSRDSAREQADLIVAGAGAAGLYGALCAARAGATVALISSTPLAQTASYWAQGGLAAAVGADDSPELHLADTELAGRGAVRRSAAEVLVREAPACLRDLQELGVRFDGDRFGHLALGLEGGHSARRIVHGGGSATGRRMLRELAALAVSQPLIEVLEGERAAVASLMVEQGRCVGVICRDGRTVRARAVILATGGAAALWSRTTNPPGSAGVGLMLARAAGAALADLELVQFHPTAVCGVAGREGFLITEAIRGEGAVLLDAHGERFVDELAPRDEVSRAIWRRMAEGGAPSVSLDMRSVDPAHFPNVFGALREAGLDPAETAVPVAPAAHYMIGGVRTDLHGRSTVPGLLAVGETSCTGLHGANRLASNSLSECCVFAARAAAAALADAGPSSAVSPPAPDPASKAVVTTPSRDTREAMWRHAGIERTREGLEALLPEPHPLAVLIARCAIERAESRGVHQRTDFPETDSSLDGRHLVVSADGEMAWESWV
ncbi:MAG: L-aspartate oxidase [Solirubrobacteraceae bacterium]